jgi:hypothetical protein
MHAGLLDVFHHATDDNLHVDLDGVPEESVDEHRSFGRKAALVDSK